MIRLSGFFVILLSFFLVSGCAVAIKESTDTGRPFILTDNSKGLPVDGLWRQNVVLADMDGDGFLDIVAPPQRKAKLEQKRPSIFIWDRKEGKWKEGSFRFPEINDFNYGGVAAGDVNKDGFFDIALASHGTRIILLLNDTRGGFIEAAFPTEPVFPSRTISLSDINGDGWLDIVALSESPAENIKKGIFLGINKEGKEWDVRLFEEQRRFFGDSLAVSDINGDGNKDIIVTPLTTIKEDKKIVWLGDGKGNFQNHKTDVFGDLTTFSVRAGDIDGDGRDEAVFKLAGAGKDAQVMVTAFKWVGDDLKELSSVNLNDIPIVFDLADIDGDSKVELIVLSLNGFHIYKYVDKAWVEMTYHPLPSEETKGAYNLTAGKQGDGSWLIVYNLGAEIAGTNNGIRAYLLK